MIKRQMSSMKTYLFVCLVASLVGRSKGIINNLDIIDKPVGIVCREDQKAEIVFIIDTSSSLGRRGYSVVQGFVSRVIQDFHIGPDNVRVGVCMYSSRIREDIKLKDFNDKQDLIDAIKNTRYIGGGTYTHKALKLVRDKMLDDASTRPGVPRIAILITDGMSRYPDKTKAEAKLTRDAAIDIIAIGLTGAEYSELLDIAGTKHNTAYVDTFDAFAGQNDEFAKTVIKTTCQHIIEIGPPEGKGPPEGTPDKDDDAIYFLQREPKYVKKPVPLGSESGIIPNSAFSSNCNKDGSEPFKARLNGEAGWIPCDGANLVSSYIQINLGAVVPLHGVATQGHGSIDCWVESYTLSISLDGQTFTTLDNVNGTAIMVFTGGDNQVSTKYHCLHRMYNKTIDALFVRFNVVKAGKCAGWRIELYGYRDPNDPAQLAAIKDDVWTEAWTGCKCYFDTKSTDCACCEAGGCQCPYSNMHQCVQCGTPHLCGIPNPPDPSSNVDGWTKTPSGCPCDHNPLLTNCACCQNYGCQCGSKNLNQCVNCGHPEHCGQKEDVFGPNDYCTPKTCPLK